MAWQSSTAWTGTDTPVLATVLNGIGSDLRTWGGAVDAGGYGLSNLSSLLINSAAGPSSAQVRVSANNAGSVSLFAYAADNCSLNFDSDFSSGAWRARNTSAFQFYKTGGKLTLYADSGLVSGNTFTPTARITILSDGKMGLGKAAPGTALAVVGLPTHADNAAAIAAGRTAGDFYRTSTGSVQVVY